MFRRMDDDGSKALGFEEFSKGLRDTGLELDDEGYREMFETFDKDSSGQLSIDEFLYSVRVRQTVQINIKLMTEIFLFPPAPHEQSQD